MKLYKEGQHMWAARKRLDPEVDIDVVVQEMGCGRTITTVNFCKSYCPEGMIMDWTYDHAEVIQWQLEKFTGSARVDHGKAKLFCWSGKPTKLQIAGPDHSINLEYEQ